MEHRVQAVLRTHRDGQPILIPVFLAGLHTATCPAGYILAMAWGTATENNKCTLTKKYSKATKSTETPAMRIQHASCIQQSLLADPGQVRQSM
jgi:hypothetical protein